MLRLLVLRNGAKGQITELDERSSSPGVLSAAASDQTTRRVKDSTYSANAQNPHELPEPDMCLYQLHHARRARDARQLLYQLKVCVHV